MILTFCPSTSGPFICSTYWCFWSEKITLHYFDHWIFLLFRPLNFSLLFRPLNFSCNWIVHWSVFTSSQVLPRLPTRFCSCSLHLINEFPVSFHLLPSRTQPTSPQAVSHKEFNVRSLEFIPEHKDSNWIPSGFLARSCTRCQILPLLHIVSQVSAHILPSHTLSMPHPTPSHREFHVRHLQTPVVIQVSLCP